MFELNVLVLWFAVLITGAINLTLSPLADVGKLDITTLGGDAALLNAISAGTTSSPPTVESVSFIRIQFVLADLDANCSPVDAAVNVAVPEPDTVAAVNKRLVSYR